MNEGLFDSAQGGPGERLPALTCEVSITRVDRGEMALAFSVRNPGAQPVSVRYFRPYIDFDVAVESGGRPVRVTQPAYDVPAQPQPLTLRPGESARLDTPIHLRFAGSSAASRPTLWTLEHAPAPITLRVTLRLAGATVEPCAAHYDPV